MTKLIGTNPNQVPSNADLGTAAFMDKKEFLLSKGSSLSAINAIIPKTAVDVFIYDTRKDSDGGAWRKRTQHTSWYNERLNTTVRGTRKEFPVVAVIVLEVGGSIEGTSVDFTIYDGDDPDMPMWMQYRFDHGGGNNTGIAALNGIIAYGGTDNGVLISDFVKDRMRLHNHVHRHTYGSIAPGRLGRTTAAELIESSITGYSIANQIVNDVAMTVLPNAPIDSATGLPVPTIAVATRGGVSVIKDDGTVVNKVTTDTDTYSATVDFTKDGYLIVTRNNYSYFVVTDLTAASASHPSGWPSVNYFRSNGSQFPGPNGPCNNPHGDQQYGLANRAISLDNTNAASADIYGLNVFDINRGTLSTSNSVAYVTSDYNTGWMIGDIKLATMSDTDATNVSDTNLNPYTPATGNLGSITLNPKKTYKITITGYGDIDGLWPGFGAAIDGVYFYTGSTTAPGVAQATLNIQDGGTSGSPVSTTVYIKNFPSWSFSTWGTGTVTGYSVQECDYNRTVSCHPVEIIGTVTKTAVAVGAELMAYNTNAVSTRLKFTDASDLAFGTGDFTIMMWIKEDSFTTNHYVMDKVIDGSGSTGRLYVIIDSSGKHLFGIPGATAITSTGTSVAEGVWQLVSFIRRSGTLYFGINGDIVDSRSAPSSTENGTTGHSAYIGDYYGGQANYGFDGMALFRASKTAVTNDQLRKIYNDEKVLFQENAKATLYGSSDAVTALAYDDDTELLHAGTSAGRSVFQGLRRIDNTTDAVGAAISASNGMVAED